MSNDGLVEMRPMPADFTPEVVGGDYLPVAGVVYLASGGLLLCHKKTGDAAADEHLLYLHRLTLWQASELERLRGGVG